MTKKKFPDAITIILGIMVVFILFTWIIPAGEYQYKQYNGREIVIPGSYERVEPNPQGIFALLTAPIKGFMSAAQIIGFCFLVGGAFGILNRTGAIDAGLNNVINYSRNHQQSKKWIIVLLMIAFSLCGATFGMSESVLVFIMITVPLALALGYDSIVGISISFLAAGAGFAGALTNPFTIGIAQGIAEIPLFSGWEYRVLIWFVLTATAIIFVLIYARRIEKTPSLSPVYEIDKARSKEEYSANNSDMKFTFKRKVVLMLLLLSLVVIVIGSNKWSWYINEISALFIALGIFSAIIYRLKTSETVRSFLKGAKDMVMAGIVIGLAKGLLIIATDGKIIGTMLNYLVSLTENMSTVVSVHFMFAFQAVLNFFVPSGSGQAALTMPIMAPLSDLLGISRQTAVLCFQMGDGIFNMIIPTSGVTMGVLSIAKIPYNKWVRWLLPLVLIYIVLVLLLLIPPVLFFNYK
ncbi:MAG TPA: putative basic amino acid antiporter YfcC [Bacteroidales bacterium]|jgi:uncharacterized ion transporter superfamily protein YfcC|nr:putative basic amino acid antiporter YfcC [Bacteroidales bacterium]